MLGIVFSCVLSLIIGISCIFSYFYLQANDSIELLYSFMRISSFDLTLGINIDILSTISGAIVSIITLCTYIYSIFYMDKEKSLFQYYGLLNLFYLGMLGFIFSPNLFQMFVFWGVISAISYLLIGFERENDIVSKNSQCAYLTNIIGDITFFTGFIILSNFICDVANNNILASINFSNYNEILPLFLPFTDSYLYSFICIMFVISAMIKSAQFPLNFWIINAMSAPTPVSALIHSSTLVMMGAFLLIRLYPMLIYSQLAYSIILIVGASTAIITGVSALVQTKLKKALAYSTSSQLGLVFLAIGLYKPMIAFAYLIVHAFVKSLLFFSSGIAIKTTNTTNILFMGGLRKKLLITTIAFLIGAISLSGIGFCGFSIKSLLASSLNSSNLVSIFFVVIGFMTTLYIFRLYFLIFENKEIADITTYNKMKYGNIVLLIISTIIVFLTFLFPYSRTCLIHYCLSLLAIYFAFLFYNTKIRIKRVPVLYQMALNGFYLNKFYSCLRWDLYNYWTSIIKFVDSRILGGIEGVIKKGYKSISNILYKAQNNNVQSYISYGIWCLILLILFFTIIYTFILNYFGV